MIYRPAGEPFQQSICWMRFFPPFKGFGKSSLPGKDPGRTMSMYYWRRVIKRYNHGSTGGSPVHADIYLSCQCQRNKISSVRHWVIPLRSDSNLCAEWIHGKFLSGVLIDEGKMALLICFGNIVGDLRDSWEDRRLVINLSFRQLA